MAGLAAVTHLFATAALAHDLWIEPSSFRTETPARIDIVLRVGERFRGDLVLREEARIERFVLAGPDGETSIAGENGRSPAGVAHFERPGLYVVGYRSKRSPITLPAAQFESYLKEEGLESILALRAEGGEQTRPGREVFSRCAKALILAGGGKGDGFDRVLGFTLEIVPEQNPFTLEPGTPLPIRVEHRGKPLAGALVVALRKESPALVVSARTDGSGRVGLLLDRPGVWLVKTVHMVHAPAGANADWESLWGSLTFDRALAS